MDLEFLRQQIDQIDDELVKLFLRRMEISAQIASCKKEKGLPILMPAREQEKLADVAKKSGANMAEYTRDLYCTLFELSRKYQSMLSNEAV